MSKEKVLTKKDLRKAAWRWLIGISTFNYETQLAPSTLFSVYPCLRKMYPDDEDLKKSCLNYMRYYNTMPWISPFVIGAALGIEDEGGISSLDAVNDFKVGLMGPLAGIGDTINHGMLRPLLLSMFIPLAAEGNWLAGVGPLLIWGVAITFLAYTLVTKGYTLGRKSVVSILKSGKLNQFIKTASVIGLFMMGALSSTYVKLVTPISWANAVGEKQLLQDVLNKIFPNILPLLVVFGIYFYIKKSGPKYVRILVSILVLSVVLSFFGIV